MGPEGLLVVPRDVVIGEVGCGHQSGLEWLLEALRSVLGIEVGVIRPVHATQESAQRPCGHMRLAPLPLSSPPPVTSLLEGERITLGEVRGERALFLVTYTTLQKWCIFYHCISFS